VFLESCGEAKSAINQLKRPICPTADTKMSNLELMGTANSSPAGTGLEPRPCTFKCRSGHGDVL